MLGIFYPYGIILQAFAILHFVRRRPDGYWLWIILIGGGLGALVYIVAEVLPDVTLLRGSVDAFSRRRRIQELQAQLVDNPSVGNYEELGDLCLDDRQFTRARECFDRVIAARPDSIDARYHRALAAIGLEDCAAAVADLELVTATDQKYDYNRAAGLLAHCLGQTGRPAEADALFQSVLEVSTLSETQYNYAAFLAAQGRSVQARQWADKVLNKKHTMPNYLRRRERPWFRKASALIKRLPAAA
jgi:hypothetical protein